MRETKFFLKYSVIRLKRNGIFEYYLSKDGYGDLLFMYGTETECDPPPEMVLQYIQTAIADEFWKD